MRQMELDQRYQCEINERPIVEQCEIKVNETT